MANWTLGPQDFRRAVEAEVRERVDAQYESRIAEAGSVGRLWVRLERWLTIQREIRRELETCRQAATGRRG